MRDSLKNVTGKGVSQEGSLKEKEVGNKNSLSVLANLQEEGSDKGVWDPWVDSSEKEELPQVTGDKSGSMKAVVVSNTLPTEPRHSSRLKEKGIVFVEGRYW